MKLDVLKEKEEIFCVEFAKTYNKTEAAIKAGYGKKKDGSVNRRSAAVAACRLMEKPLVKARVGELFSDAVNNAGATPLYIAAALKTVSERCLQEITPKREWDSENKCWKESGVFQFNASGATGALKVLADMQGLCKNTTDMQSDSEVSMNLTVIDGKKEV